MTEDESHDAVLRAVARTPELHPFILARHARYELGELLGEGGFGTVYEAFDRERCATVAIKLLHRVDPRSLRRFKDEFRTLAGLRHPGIVRLFDLHGGQGNWYFTMERILGRPFDASLGDQERVRQALARLADALHALHLEGIVHRDIKPSNVLVEPGGRVVLLDFGLARTVGDAGSAAIAGTPAYLASGGRERLVRRRRDAP